MPRWVFRYVGNKTFDFSSKKKDFLPKNDQIWPKTGIFGQFGPGLFSALLMGRLVIVARGLYLARHLFTLFYYFTLSSYFIYKGLVSPLGRARAASPFATVVFNAGRLSRVEIVCSNFLQFANQ